MSEAREAVVRRWQVALLLSDWRIGLSSTPPDGDDERSSVDIDRNLHRAVIRFDPTVPEDQVERQVVHELLHVRLAEIEDAFRQVVGDDSTAATWWHRSLERTIERLVDALLPDCPRYDYRGGVAWVTSGPMR